MTTSKNVARPPCGGASVDVMADLISEPTTYRLEAHRVGGGAPLVEEIAIGGSGGAFQRVRIRNQSGRTYVVWKIDGVYQNAADIPMTARSTRSRTAPR